MKRSDYRIPGIYVNSKQAPYAAYIVLGDKPIETRNRATLDPFLGKRVGIIETGTGAPYMVGWATITGKKLYTGPDAFRADEHLHKVRKGSTYDIRPGGSKIGYLLSDPHKLNHICGIGSSGRSGDRVAMDLTQTMLAHLDNAWHYAGDSDACYRHYIRVLRDFKALADGNGYDIFRDGDGYHELFVKERPAC